MAKTAQDSVAKWIERGAVSVDDYLKGARSPKRSQSASAIAAQPLMLAGVTQAITSGRWAARLRSSGDAGHLAGIEEKGATNYPTGIGSPRAASKYVANSGRFDSARNAAAGAPRGPKGSPQNLANVAKVVAALRAVKTGSAT
jgi:hypothetical protein